MLKGSYVALVTPFKNNEIDYNALENLIDFHLENGTDGILFCGTTGEAPSLAGDEKERLINFGLQKIDGRIPVMMGTGTNNLSHTIAATSRAKEWGVNSALVITPYYNKPTQNGLYLYVKAVAENTDIPIVIYNVPGRTGVNISAATTLKLAHEFKNIVGIKEASGDLVQLCKIVKDAPKDFSVLSGEDALNFPILCCGGKGVISVTANILPKQVHDVVEMVQKRKYEKAREIHLELSEINEALFYETNPIPVKEALHLMGMIEQEFRLPICKMEAENLAMLKSVLENYKLN
ncbi:MAG: 4-hydroxy-tetrahydrodipicolinate synthase [Candidatus Cloacimonetes bacterium]|nr:4-hydroxy-tetrahydrodipicolinate synthase [Candidatus Cloacimonadota bacterium]MCF7813530.1 4-hydroxy-tetrahydrodipicolinate synthase [Candidatus Cloacimonadota bacterium]MCF7868686.1 4-hydroxy-tetrahydrodipicolinate synthase [Candidatus Cloacimonadota bacterium]MCF7884184.1 4-hydroxy-tetrahydrodipicolinate synthase [Candidatus Cloacimonadota bacterium]